MIIKVIPKKLDNTVTAKEINSFVGDYCKTVIEYISCANAFGNRVRIADGTSSAVKEKILAFNAKGTKIKVEEPYLLPAFAVLACYAFSKTEITVADKELLSQTENLLSCLGVGYGVNGNILTVNGKGGLKGGVRIKVENPYVAMATVLMGTETTEPIEVQTTADIKEFLELFSHLGGKYEIIE